MPDAGAAALSPRRPTAGVKRPARRGAETSLVPSGSGCIFTLKMFRGSGGIRQAVLRGGPPVSGARVGRSPESGKPFQGVFVLKTLPEPGGARLRSDAGAAAARLRRHAPRERDACVPEHGAGPQARSITRMLSYCKGIF